ncbi:hypothetical protein BD311DRAFT_654870 [Dichomitus squalens]|uniref:Zn(2)-C6 fungal-type domain-containing protein n=1 Tax=Dichomitus squalens TaxID=114155 RepID=A0A4Q9MWA1_9APHY|nr:hypothetical protein BD311DRAFT_654870 [Dichomitus squalens]
MKMKNIFKKKRTRSPHPACTPCSDKKVKCNPINGVGLPCQACIQRNGMCEWPLGSSSTRHCGPDGHKRGVRSCQNCRASKMRCEPASHPSGACRRCRRANLDCSFAGCYLAGEASPSNDGQSVAGPSNQRMANDQGTYSPGIQHPVAGGSQSSWLTVDTGVANVGGSVSSAEATPTSGPSSPSSYWLTVMGAEDSDS